MPGDIALAGFLLTAEEWLAFEPAAREQLIAAARGDDGWTARPLVGAVSEPLADAAP